MAELVFQNLNTYPVAIQNEWGYSLTVPPTKAVKGDWYARFAASGLTAMRESEVDPTAIIAVSKPKNDGVAANWAASAEKALGAETVAELTTEPEPVIGPEPVEDGEIIIEPKNPGDEEGTEPPPPADPTVVKKTTTKKKK